MTSLSPPSRYEQKPLIPGWHRTASDRRAARRFVTVNPDAIPALMPWLEPNTEPNEAWRSYVGPIDAEKPDLSRLFYELALTISQFGGFVGYHPDGHLHAWKSGGSGVKAVLATIDAIRAAGKLPGMAVPEDLDRDLAHFFIRTPFGKERLDIFKELATGSARRSFDNLLKLARRRDGSYCFSVLHMKGLACRFPLAFGQDPIFHKKSSLLLMTMEIALNQLGQRAIAETLPPADYRIPQILEGLGILTMSERLSKQIEQGHVFRIDDPQVDAIRAATVDAVGLIKARYEEQIERPTTCAELDGALYLLSRNRALMARQTMKPHVLVATAAF